MTDLASDFDFTAASNAAEEAALSGGGVEVTTTAPPEDTPGQTRDEQGRFAAEPEVETPAEEAAPADEAVPLTDPEIAAYLQKYGGDTDKALRAAVEAQKLIGQQGSELGELRRMFEQFQEEQQNQPAAQASADPNELHDYYLENQAEIIPAINHAYQAGDNGRLYAALGALGQISPVQAEAVRTAIAKAEAQKTFAELNAPYAKQAQDQQLKTEIQAVTARNPGISDFSEDQIGAVATDFPVLFEQLAKGNPAQQAQAFEAMWQIHRARHAETLQATTQQVARATAEEAQKAADDAYVASSTPTQPAEEKTAAQLEADRMAGLFKQPSSVWEDAKSWDTSR